MGVAHRLFVFVDSQYSVGCPYLSLVGWLIGVVYMMVEAFCEDLIKKELPQH